MRETGGTDSFVRSVLLDAERLNELDTTSANRIKRPLQIYNRALFEIPSFVRWHANSTYGQAVSAAISDAIVALMDATNTQRKLLERTNNREFKKQDEQRIVEQSRRVSDALGDAREMFDAQIDLVLSNPTSPRSVLQIEAFLRSSLPNADQRSRLLQARDVVLDYELPDTLPDADNALGAQEWAWANSQLELESKLLELVSDAPSEQLIASTWRQLKSASRSLREAYQLLPLDTHDVPIGHRLFFVDARDSGRVASTMASLGRWDLPTHEIAVSVNVADISTSVGENSPATVVVQLSNPEQKVVTVRLGRFERISVAYSESPAGRFSPIRPRGEIKTTTNANGTATLHFHIAAVAEQKAESVNPVEELQLQITAEDPYYSKRAAKISCYLPKENRIDLVARLVDSTGIPVTGPMRRETTWAGRPLQSIELFPNTKTSYKLYLSNRSGKPKQVDVQLLQVPTVRGQLGLHRFDTQALRRLKSRLVDPDTSQPLPRVKVLAKTSQPIDLPLDGKQTFLQLSPPSPPAEPTSTPPASAEVDAAPNPGTDVTLGLVCFISSADGSGESWLKWIGLLPRHPSTYVDTVARVTENNNLLVTVKARTDAPLPIPVEFELPDRTNQLDVIEDTNVPIEFSVDGSTLDGAAFDVVLHVHGYPRAIVMRTELSAGNFETREADRNRRRIRIQGIRVDKQAADLGNSQTRTTAFPMAKPSLVHVQLAVDAPVDEFGRGADDRVRITLGQGAAQKREVFDFDRKMTARFQPLGKQGQLVFETAVGDISTALRANATNVTATLQAELTAGSQTIDDRHRLILDGNPPRGEIDVANRKLKMGTDVQFRWLAKDRSGIAKAEFALVDDITKPFPDEAKTFPQNVASDRMQTFQLPTTELKIGSGRTATFWVKGRFTDGVGFTSVARSNPFVVANIPDQQSGGNSGEEPVTGKLVVIVQVASGRTPQKPTATIKDHDELAGVEVSDGRFEFADVPAGKYDVVVTGIAGGRPKEGTKTIVLKSPADYAKDYPVDVK